MRTAASSLADDEEPIYPINKALPRWRRVLNYLLLALSAVLCYKVAALGFYAWSAGQSSSAILQQLQIAPQLASVATLQPEFQQLARDIAGLESHLQFFSPLLGAVQIVPVYGPTLAAAPNLLIVGRELTAIAEQYSQVTVQLEARKALSAQNVATVLESNPQLLDRMVEEAESANRAIQAIPSDQLHPSVTPLVAQAQSVLPSLAGAIRLLPAMPTLLGMDQARTWLVLVQNNHELRATGGFITAVGQLTLDRGKIADLEFTDSYNIYDPSGGSGNYPPSPPPMRTFMDISILLFRDANWSPDLTTTAQLARTLYRKDTGVEIDGIVTIDLSAAQLLVGALGELMVEGSDQPITAASFLEQIKQFWSSPLPAETNTSSVPAKDDWWSQRKDFMPLVAAAAMQRLQAGQVSYPALLQATITALERRHIQIWSVDKPVADLLGSLGWDGSLHPIAKSDFLALVDTNMGYNKVNAILQRNVEYQVVWPADGQGPAQATVTILYTHPLAGEIDCDQTPRYGATYDEMMQRCYFNYVRIYAPGGSKLVSSEGLRSGSISELRGEKSTQVFGGFFVMQAGTQHVVSFTYTLPPTLTADNYRLLIQRQSGTAALPVVIKINGQEAQQAIEAGQWYWPSKQ